MFYALNPYHLLIVYWRSAYAELLAATLLPLLLLCLLRLKEPGFRPTLWLSLTLSAAWLTNLPAAVMIHYSTPDWPALAAFAAAECRIDHGVRCLRTALAARTLEQAWPRFICFRQSTNRDGSTSARCCHQACGRRTILFSPTIADPDHNRFNLLVSTIALAEIGVLVLAIWFSRRTRHAGTAAPGCPGARSAAGAASNRSPWMLLSAWGAASALLMLSPSNLLWQHLPKLRFVQLPFRWLLCMNAALAMLLSMASKRWTSRVLAFAILLAVSILAGYRIQAPWWDMAGDIREMSDAIADGTGYEGSDEYVPAGADAYELNKSLPRVSDDRGAPVPSEMLAWAQTEKHFKVHPAAAQNLTVRLFSYPAWEVVVNGKPIETQRTDVTGLIVIPIAAGDNDVRIRFRRTIDRLVGNVVSLISLAAFVLAWIRTVRLPIPYRRV